MTARICECKKEEVRKGWKPGVLIKISHYSCLYEKTDTHIVVGTFDGWVSLTDPSHTWRKTEFLNTEHLPKGTCVEYISEV